LVDSLLCIDKALVGAKISRWDKKMPGSIQTIHEIGGLQFLKVEREEVFANVQGLHPLYNKLKNFSKSTKSTSSP
jgi:hypothetical protein